MNTKCQIGYQQFFGFEERQYLQTSLAIVQKENHLNHIFVWGRIFTCKNDYVIAFGYVDDVLKTRKFFYTTNLLDWGLLPSVTDERRILGDSCTTDFLGIPSAKIPINQNKINVTPETLNSTFLKEEDRLASTIEAITNECFIIPRGAILRLANNVTIENPGFSGLLETELTHLSSYQHFRLPLALNANTNFIKKSNYVYSIDCFDSIEFDDVHVWSLQVVRYAEQVHLRSLDWPGFLFIYDCLSKQFGSIYSGDGIRNKFNFV